MYLVFRLRTCASGWPLNTIMNQLVHKMRVNSWGSKGLSVGQCGFCPVHLVCYLLIALLPVLFIGVFFKIGGFGYLVARGAFAIFVFRRVLRSWKERLIWRPYPSMLLSVCDPISATKLFVWFSWHLGILWKSRTSINLMKMGSLTHTLLEGVNEILLVLFIFLNLPGCN